MSSENGERMKNISVTRLAQIENANIEFGDLTVLIGPQATGKSIFLQLVKLLLDDQAVIRTLENQSINWGNDLGGLLNVYFGEGMSGICKAATSIQVDSKPRSLKEIAEGRRGRHDRPESIFYIPAQRVLALRDGITHPFSDYRAGDPFVLRDFSDKLHQLIQNNFSREAVLFPHPKRLKSALKDKIDKHIFTGMQLESVSRDFQKRMVLNAPGSKNSSGLPYLTWSAGQREFTPLLMGLYWLLPPAQKLKRPGIDWVVMEEPEMGLHPDGISTAILLMMELLARNYKVLVSTHSTYILDTIWAIQAIRKHKEKKKFFMELFDLPMNAQTTSIAEGALKKKYKVHYFNRGGSVLDISNLDPGSEDEREAGWGGLTDFSSRAADVVGKAME